MNRIMEAMKAEVACIPVSLAASTDSTAIYISAAKNPRLAFAISTGALASGKKLTVSVYGAANPSGTGAEKLGEQVFTASGAMPSAVAVVDVHPRADYSHYAVKFQHNAAAEVICSALALGEGQYLPVGNDWTLTV